VKILFSMRHLGSLRIYESVLRALAAAGHELLVLANRRESIGSMSTPEALLAEVPGVRLAWDETTPTWWIELGIAVRIWRDYLRYFEPRYADFPRLRSRVGERVPPLLRRITEWPLVQSAAGRSVLARCLRTIERALPRQQALDALMRDYRPDVVLLTPVLHLGSPQVEVLRSARAVGARTALGVASWDHLASKSLIREAPDRVLVWNDTQRREAIELHGVPAERITITGAQCYDQWFGRVPVRTREQFCSMLRLPAGRPFLLFACSALYPRTPPEARFVRRWIDEIRASADPVLQSAAILVRPHPARLDEWQDVDLSDLRDVTLYGSLPLDECSKEGYFESLYYSGAVIGLNTSAFLEASILGRPVHTIVVPEFSERQEGTPHFQYLLSAGGGLLSVARTFDEHRVQLAASLREPQRADRNERFVTAFIRPLGLDRAATDTFVDAVEDLGRMRAPAPAGRPFWAPLAQLALLPVAMATHAAVANATNPADRTFVELRQARRKEQHRREREAEEERRRARREAERLDKIQHARTVRDEELRRRQERLDASVREKRERTMVKVRRKRRHERMKRRAVLKQRIKQILGLT
jgi:hypothetical protein